MIDRQIVPLPQIESAISDVKQLRNMMRQLREEVLVEGLDYGVIPGTDKPSLWQPGMEKMMRMLRVVPRYRETAVLRDYERNIFHYEYECELVDVDTDRVIPGARAIGLCTSKESKYGYRWVNREQVPSNLNADELPQRNGTLFEFAFAVEQSETTGKYGKPAEYWQSFKDAIANGTARKVQKETKNKKKLDGWEIGGIQYRIPNPDVFDQINTICKMAQKRALGSAVKGAAGVSEYFTVDLEDLERYDMPITVSMDDGREVDAATGEVVAPEKQTTTRLGQQQAWHEQPAPQVRPNTEVWTHDPDKATSPSAIAAREAAKQAQPQTDRAIVPQGENVDTPVASEGESHTDRDDRSTIASDAAKATEQPADLADVFQREGQTPDEPTPANLGELKTLVVSKHKWVKGGQTHWDRLMSLLQGESKTFEKAMLEDDFATMYVEIKAHYEAKEDVREIA